MSVTPFNPRRGNNTESSSDPTASRTALTLHRLRSHAPATPSRPVSAPTPTIIELQADGKIRGRPRPTEVGSDRCGLRIIFLGMRGFPNVQGGVEKHVEKLASALSTLGCEIEAIVRTEYVPKGITRWRDIKIVRLWNSPMKGVETFLHSFFGVLHAACRRPDILHIHGIGPAIFAPLARALGLRVVVTYHSLNYEHAKWGRFARALLRFGEWSGMTFSHGRIVISRGLAQRMKRTYGISAKTIPNGLDKPMVAQTTHTLQAFGLSPRQYALSVARIDEAKRQFDLIAAYARIPDPGFRLALVGEADHYGAYARAVGEAARNTPGVVLLGHQTGNSLAELYTHAGVFVLPSSHEGQPIAVLEAASYGLPAILSDIPAHRELAIPGTRYVGVGDVEVLARQLADFFSANSLSRIAAEDRNRLIAQHDWDDIARQTMTIYLSALSNQRTPRCRSKQKSARR